MGRGTRDDRGAGACQVSALLVRIHAPINQDGLIGDTPLPLEVARLLSALLNTRLFEYV